MLKLGDLSFNGSDFLDSGLDFDFECFFDHLKFSFIGRNDSLEPAELFEQFWMLTQVVDSVGIKDDNTVGRQIFDKFREEFVHVLISAEPRTDDP